MAEAAVFDDYECIQNYVIKDKRLYVQFKYVPKMKFKDTYDRMAHCAEHWQKAPDPAVERVLERMKERSRQGMLKYGVPIGEFPGDLRHWLIQMQEELTDAAIYIERAILEIDKK